MTKRGFTMVEVMLAAVLTAVLVGVLGMVYVFTLTRASHVTAKSACTLQASRLADEIEKVVTNSQSCAVVTVGSTNALRCTMPAGGTDLDGDGISDAYSPTTISRRGVEEFGPAGNRVWFFQADGTGTLGNSGTAIWRAKRTDASNATTLDLDLPWSKYYGSDAKWGLIDSLSFSVNAATKTVTITVHASSLSRSECQGDGTAASEEVTFTRSVIWRNWRQ